MVLFKLNKTLVCIHTKHGFTEFRECLVVRKLGWSGALEAMVLATYGP